MEYERDCPVEPGGIIEITEDGYPIVTGEYACPYWQVGARGLCAMHECWYCKFSDFRKTSRVTLQKSICRNPHCRIVSTDGVSSGARNEGAEGSG